jgi:hypothetical protein
MPNIATGLQLPTNVSSYNGQSAQGFATPTQDTLPQVACFVPKRVLPIVFLPGIMGSNLRISDAERQRALKKKDNIAWRPDIIDASNAHELSTLKPRQRQLLLDPNTTTVDIYDPMGPTDVSGDGRHGNVKLSDDYTSPMLAGALMSAEHGKTSDQKARERGWGEVYFKSYGSLLQHLERRLSRMFVEGGKRVAPEWLDIVGVDPGEWMPDASLPQTPLSAEELKAFASGCWFPVYAFGYNWLLSNGISAKALAGRITVMMNKLNQAGYDCRQVIVVTHSMGGLVGRALIHPDYGNLGDKVLGIVHGVMPAIGAGAAYKRIRAGFEDPGFSLTDSEQREASVGAKIAGNYGDEVTAVLANAPGGLELLPNQAYGNGWLKVMHQKKTVASWPTNGDPYEEIYKVRGKWYSLMREEWINPSGLAANRGGGSMQRTCKFLDQAKRFHEAIVDTYHPCSYGHYGVDKAKPSFGDVVWEISPYCENLTGWENWPILQDSRQGRLELVRWSPDGPNPAFGQLVGASVPNPIFAVIRPPTEPGDQTVPMRSADHQLRSGKFKGIFRQEGYEHQGSYKSRRAIASTLFSIVRIAQGAKWNC